jgi:hypothetical protein
MIALLKHDFRRITLINVKLFGQQLPITLRQFIWTECLLRLEKKPFDYDLVCLYFIKKLVCMVSFFRLLLNYKQDENLLPV